MGTDGIEKEVEQFVHRHLHSIMELEVLLHLRRYTERAWDADDLARALYLQPASTSGLLQGLHASGLLSSQREGGGPSTYRYAPRDAETARLVDRIAELYTERRVSMVNLVFSRPSDSLRSFSNAFKFGRKEP